MNDDGPGDAPPTIPGLTELLQALVQVGRIAESMLAQQASRPTASPQPVPADAASDDEPASHPSPWRDSIPQVSRPFFTKHAADRLHERYGVPYANVVSTMAALSHQIRGTHFTGIEAVNLGKRPPSDGVDGTLWAVEIYRQVGFVVTDDEQVIVTVLPRDTKQLQQLHGPQRAALEAFRTELHLRSSAPAASHKHPGRDGA